MQKRQKRGKAESAATSAGRTRCEVWTRVMGYHRPVSHFNIAKKAEHYSRKHFTETVAANHAFSRQYAPAVCEA